MTQIVRNLPAMQETQVQSLDREDPLEKEMATHSRILAGESHGQRSLVDSSSGRKESATTERLTFSLFQTEKKNCLALPTIIHVVLFAFE